MDTKTELQEIKQRVSDLELQTQGGLNVKNDVNYQTHNHDGNNSQQINLFDIFGLYNKVVPPFNLLFKTVSTAPSGVPTSASEQVQIYVNGATYRLYWFDATNQVWHYVTATV